MAITACHFDFYCDLKKRGLLPQGGSILELGQAEWYGDKNPYDLRDLLSDTIAFDSCFDVADGRARLKNHDCSFLLVELFYKWLFSAWLIEAIDLHGSEWARRFDLNNELLNDPYFSSAVVINNGTAEHIFNVAQVFRTMHDACKVGGLMIHDAPVSGWVDHGFYTLQPTLFYDVARENNYEIVAIWLCEVKTKSHVVIERREQIHDLATEGKIPQNSMLLVAFRKTVDAEFKIPMQGVYAGAVSEQAVQNWKALR